MNPRTLLGEKSIPFTKLFFLPLANTNCSLSARRSKQALLGFEAGFWTQWLRLCGCEKGHGSVGWNTSHEASLGGDWTREGYQGPVPERPFLFFLGRRGLRREPCLSHTGFLLGVGFGIGSDTSWIVTWGVPNYEAPAPPPHFYIAELDPQVPWKA